MSQSGQLVAPLGKCIQEGGENAIWREEVGTKKSEYNRELQV